MKIIRVCEAMKSPVETLSDRTVLRQQDGGAPLRQVRVEPGETPQQALKREIEEELDTEIAVHEKIGTIEYDYPAFHLSMDCFWCEVLSGDLVLKEAEAARWLTKDELGSVHWLPADQTILERIRATLG